MLRLAPGYQALSKMIGTLLLVTISTLTVQSPSHELLAAVRLGDIKTLASAIADGADVNIRDEAGRTPLMLASRRGDDVMVTSLLYSKADPNLQDSRGTTALLLAARHSPAIVSALLEAGANVAHENNYGLNALTAAKAEGATEIETLLRQAGASEDLEERLHEAIVNGEDEEVSRLIAEGADVDAHDAEDYRTPLMNAIEHRQLDVIARLLEAGADPTLEATGIFTWRDNAITLAAKQENPWALNVMIQAGTRQKDLDRAVLSGCAHPIVLRVLLEANADVNARGDDGQTPLMCAAAAGATEAVSALLAAGARFADVSEDGRTALEWAEHAGHDGVVAVLKQAAAKR